MKPTTLDALIAAYAASPEIAGNAEALSQALAGCRQNDSLGVCLAHTARRAEAFGALSKAAKDEPTSGEAATALYRQLRDEYALRPYHATWAVNAWLRALGAEFVLADTAYAERELASMSVEKCKMLAEKGDAYAAMELYERYRHAENGVDKADNAAAVKWLTLAASLDYTAALTRFGAVYLANKIVPENIDKTLEALHRARTLGDYEASALLVMALSVHYENSEYARIMIYKKEGAEHGNAYCAYEYGVTLFEGAPDLGVEPNPEEGRLWLEKAAEMGEKNALYELGVILQEGKATQKDAAAALAYFIRAANAGNESAYGKIISAYQTGEGAQKDEKQAAEWIKKAREAGVDTSESEQSDESDDDDDDTEEVEISASSKENFVVLDKLIDAYCAAADVYNDLDLDVSDFMLEMFFYLLMHGGSMLIKDSTPEGFSLLVDDCVSAVQSIHLFDDVFGQMDRQEICQHAINVVDLCAKYGSNSGRTHAEGFYASIYRLLIVDKTPAAIQDKIFEALKKVFNQFLIAVNQELRA